MATHPLHGREYETYDLVAVVAGRGEVVSVVVKTVMARCRSGRPAVLPGHKDGRLLSWSVATDSRAGPGCEGTGTYPKVKGECNVLVEGVFLVCFLHFECFMCASRLVCFPTSRA